MGARQHDESSQKINHDEIKERQAIAFLQAGKLKEAETIYRELVEEGSQNHVVYGNLAAILQINGQKEGQINLLRNALKIKPDYPIAHYNLGNALREQGDLDAAIYSYQQAIKLKPDYSDALINLGIASQEQGDLNTAISSYQQALKLKSDYPEAHYNLGNALKAQDDLNAAISSFKQAIQLKPDYPEAYNNLGNALKKQGNLSVAISSFKQALKLKSDYAEAYNNLGIALQEQGDLNSAISSYQQAIQLKSDYPEPYNNLGNALQKQGDLSAAISSFKQALKLKSDYAEAYNNLGIALQEQGDLNTAISSYQQAIQLKSDYPEAHYNLGIASQEQGDFNAAISYYRQAIKLKPTYPEARYNLGLAFLSNGDYQQGWLGYEYRFKRLKNPVIPHTSPLIPQCHVETNNLNNKLLVVSEQGLGDTMQFMRYIPHLRQKGIDVSFCAQRKLHDLIKASGITSNPLPPEQGNEVKEGKWIPLLSVPRLLKITPDDPLVTEPYIHSSDELTAKWKKRLSKEKAPIIGVNWQGNPDTENNNLKGRSLPLELFSTIAKHHDCRFLSLQKGFGSEQLETCSFKDQFVDCQSQVNEAWDYLETASIISNCDLIITSDTSVAHLAGGMGKTTWCLLHYNPDWRWGMNGKTTFWYPSLKLFRQQERNNWIGVMERVSAELKSYRIRD